MNKVIFIFVIILSLAFFSCKKIEMPSQVKGNSIDTVLSIIPLPEKEWTFLLYDDADWGEGAYDPLNDFSKSVSSNKDINYFVLRDGSNSEASFYIIGENHEQNLLQKLGDINVGDERTLTDFIKAAKKYFPAKRYIVAFYDHGGGWDGTCGNVYKGISDDLKPFEIDNAFKNAGEMDLVLFTAPCLMGSLETEYQVRNSAKYYIASEDVSGYVYWDNMLNKFDDFVKSNPFISTEDLSKKTISLLYETRNNNPYGGEQITMSAVNLSKIENFVSAFNEVTDYYNQNINNFRNIKKHGIKNYGGFCDIYDLLRVMRTNETDTAAIKIIENAMNYFNDCIVDECHGTSNAGSYGLNIYFPSVNEFTDIYYSSNNDPLDFKNDCSWDALLVSVLRKSSISPRKNILTNIYKFNGFYPTYNH